MTFFRNFLKDRTGATAIEYGLIAALISVSLIAGVGAIGSSLQNVFGTVANNIEQPAP
ncbi:Flp family type IVb pilin [Neorhizobium sp. P12A]|jgi:pilus assembly protein Flp/PilA|uniref:Flp family type IVb pilin n=1 Tax=Rhizobium/Agrobacterium group TaxID=227290 RepID=UPI0010526F55|nr:MULTISPECIES: Flp family type IVb pilin [Rhizobium/Agrobacterium group]KAA0698509.1 Flp family type IVb pilin [Neorhizobium sp. P12A]TCR89802.1 pilus assembly protein Flp/PilA [Rhizobium sp. BK376]